MSYLFLDLQGNPIYQEQVLGYGGSAVVVLQDDLAAKAPLRYFWSSDGDVEANVEVIQREQDIYRRLQPSQGDRCPGIVDCIGFSEKTTQLAYMRNGDLRAYLEHNRPSRSLQLSWFRQMARTLAYIHDKRVLVADIACRNFLLDSDLSLKLCDFSESTLLPLDSDVDTADDNGYSTRIDIGQLGAVIYEVVTGQKCDIDLFKDNHPTDGRAYWPKREYLPSTESIWLGSIIEGCWTDGGFRNAHSLSQALDLFDLQNPPDDESGFKKDTWFSMSTVKCFIQERPITTLAAISGTLALCLVWAQKNYR